MKYSIATAFCLVILAGCGDDNGEVLPTDSPVERFTFEGHSMSPTLADGELIEVLDYAGDAPARGDIVAFAAPTSLDRVFFKRVIGLPGETIEVDEDTGDVIIDGAALDEPYLGSSTDCSTVCSWTVPEIQAEISISKDTYRPRAGPTPFGQDDACAISGCYFVLGDNRQNSSDSRQGWLVPAENILGFVKVD